MEINIPTPTPNISIIIPTLNGACYLDKLLKTISTQSITPQELIIVDSSSSDNTAQIAREFVSSALTIRYITIKREDFAHGRTRNFAASIATGEIIVFLTQDSLPAGCDWLKNLVAPFMDEAVGCVFGRHLARIGGNPLIVMDIERHFASFGNDDYTVQYVEWHSEESVGKYRLNEGWYCFNSNVNSAVRREVWEKIRFRDVMYSEDQLFGKDLIESGYKKVYARNATVFHSHDYTLPEYLTRYFDEYRGLKTTLGVVDRVGWLSFIPMVMAAALRDMYGLWYAKTDHKLYWLCYTPFFHLVRKTGAFLGGRYEKIPLLLRKYLSHENRA